MNPRHRTTAVFFAVGTVALSVLGLFVVGLWAFSPSAVSAAPTYQINYQGKLTDSSNAAVSDGTYVIRFRIYTASSGGTTLFDETQSATLTNGLFSVMLGSASTTVLETLNWNEPTYLGVTVSGDSEMTPRKVIGTVPNAFDSSRLGGVASSSFLRIDTANSTSTASTFISITQSGAGKIMELIGQSSASVLSVLSSGNVGIGTSTPARLFSVHGAGYISSGLFVGGNIESTSTVASIFPYASTTALSVSGSLYAGSLDGPLQANAGLVSATSSIGVLYGGTGLTTAPTYGQILLGSAAGTYTLTGTSTLGIALSDTTGTLSVAKGGTGQSSFGQGWLHTDGTTITSSTSPTVNYLVATSTTVASAFAYRVGVGTTTPGNTLTVSGAAGVNPFTIASSTGETLFTLTDKGYIGVGTSSPDPGLHIVSGGAGDGVATSIVTLTQYSSDAAGGSFVAAKARGTVSSPSAVQSGDDLFALHGRGFMTSGAMSSSNSASIKMVAAQTYTTTAKGAYISFATTPVGSATRYERLRVTDSGYIGIGTTSPHALLSVHGDAYISSDLFVGGNIVSTSTVASVFPYASTTALSVSGTTYLNTALTGPLQAVGGLVSASSTLSVAYGGTGANTFASNGVLYGNGGGAIQATVAGTNGNILAVSGGVPTWIATSSMPFMSTALTKGYFIVGNDAGVAQATSTIFISSTGSVGIGTSTPWASFAINPTAGAASNQFVVGSSTATNFIIDNSGRVGIGGTSTPNGNSLVDILNSTTGDWDNTLSITHSNNASEDNTAINITNTTNSGTIGIGVTTRNLRSIYNNFTPNVTLTSTADANIYGVDHSLSLSSLAFGDSATLFSSNSDLSVYGGNASISGNITYNDTADLTKQTLAIYGSNVDISSGLTITSISSGQANTADVYGGRFANAQTSPGNSDLTVTSYGVYGSATGNLTTTGTTVHYGGYFTTSGTADTNYGIWTTASGATTNYALYSQTGTNYFGGNVGIGTTTPARLFSVHGAGYISSGLFVGGNIVSTTTSASIFPYASTTGITNSGTAYFGSGSGQGSWDTSGFFSVGTTSRLNTRNAVFTNTGGYGELYLLDSTAANYSSVTKGGTYMRSNEGLFTIQGMRPDTGGGSGVYLTIDQTTSFIGSGTTTPMAFFAASTTSGNDSKYAGAFVSQTGYGLYVEGKSGKAANFQGNIDITGTCADSGSGCADVAEEYPSSEPMEPGDIAMIDVSTNKTVRKADLANRNNLIGIVATAPGVVLTDEGPVRLGGAALDPAHKPAIALAGRVPTKVSLEGGNIKPGDRISISSVRGVGMRATSTGAIVGIALETFNSSSDQQNGVGSILVYVNLSYYHLDSKIAQGVIEGSYWTLDEKTGSIKALGPVDLNNFPILNVKAIQSASGKWSIDEDGTLVVENLEVRGQATIGTPSNRSGITLFDQQTGEPYCLHINGGSISTSAGVCSSAIDNSTPPVATGDGNTGGGGATGSSTDTGADTSGGDGTTASTTGTGGGSVTPPVDESGGTSDQGDTPPNEGDTPPTPELSPDIVPPEPATTPPEAAPESTPAATPPTPSPAPETPAPTPVQAAPAADAGASAG